MAVNKVVYAGDTLIDLTGDTVTAETLTAGHTAHGKDGTPIAGVNPYAKAATDAEVAAQESLLDQAIAALQGKAAGGGGTDSGLPSGVSAIASGVYKPTSDNSSDVDIEHNLGVKPDFCWWMLEDDVSSDVRTSTNVAGCIIEKAAIYSTASTTIYNAHYFIVGYNASSTLARTASTMQDSLLTETTCCIKATTAYRLKAGCTYRWVCGVLG